MQDKAFTVFLCMQGEGQSLLILHHFEVKKNYLSGLKSM